jgi:hypothetical protein
MGHNDNIHHGPVNGDKESLVLVLHQGNSHHGPQSSSKESPVLVIYKDNTHYKRRSNKFTIVLQGLRIQEQGLDRKFQDLCWSNLGFLHLAFIIYYQDTTRRTFKKNITIILAKLDLWKQ